MATGNIGTGNTLTLATFMKTGFMLVLDGYRCDPLSFIAPFFILMLHPEGTVAGAGGGIEATASLQAAAQACHAGGNRTTIH